MSFPALSSPPGQIHRDLAESLPRGLQVWEEEGTMGRLQEATAAH